MPLWLLRVTRRYVGTMCAKNIFNNYNHPILQVKWNIFKMAGLEQKYLPVTGRQHFTPGYFLTLDGKHFTITNCWISLLSFLKYDLHCRNYLNFMTEELREPFVNLPRAIYISLPMVTGIYLLANLSYLAVLGPIGVRATDAIAVVSNRTNIIKQLLFATSPA